MAIKTMKERGKKRKQDSCLKMREKNKIDPGRRQMMQTYRTFISVHTHKYKSIILNLLSMFSLGHGYLVTQKKQKGQSPFKTFKWSLALVHFQSVALPTSH